MAAKSNQNSNSNKGEKLAPDKEAYLRASKEITVKFIEAGRLSLGSFNAAFKQIYSTIKDTVEENEKA
jgi:hypothetical protein